MPSLPAAEIERRGLGVRKSPYRYYRSARITNAFDARQGRREQNENLLAASPRRSSALCLPARNDDRTFPKPLTPTERLALEALRDGKAAGAAGIEAVIRQGWASRTGKGISITAAGERALADDEAARTAMRRP